MTRQMDEAQKAFQAQLKSDKRPCTCGKDAEVMVCPHIFYGRSSNFYWTWTGEMHCEECNYEMMVSSGGVEPEMFPICRRCTRLIFEYALNHGPRVTGPPFYYFQREDPIDDIRPMPSHSLEEGLACMTPEEKEANAGPFKWARNLKVAQKTKG